MRENPALSQLVVEVSRRGPTVLRIRLAHGASTETVFMTYDSEDACRAAYRELALRVGRRHGGARN